MEAAAVLPMGDVFALTRKASAELGGSVSTLEPAQLELVIRTDGAVTLRQIREQMGRLDDDSFLAAFRAVWQRGLLEKATADRFNATLEAKLQRLQASLGPAGGIRKGQGEGESFRMGLVWQRPVSTAGAKPGMRAVVVEDDPVLAKFIQCFLALEGFEVLLASDRNEVVQRFRSPQPPNLVLLDVSLPDADGFELLRTVRNHPSLQHVPVIMLTARATREGVLKALSLGANGYLTKPFDAEVLSRAARAVTGLADIQPEAAAAWSNADSLPDRMTRRTF